MRKLVLIMALLTAVQVQAQQYLRPKAQDYLRRSAIIIQEVGRDIPRLDSTQKKGKYAMAVAHQRMARNYYEVKDYKNAIYHSHYAREMAIEVFMINNRMLPSKFQYTVDERELSIGSPEYKILHKNLLKVNPGIKFDDNDYAIYEKLHKLDVEDIENK